MAPTAATHRRSTAGIEGKRSTLTCSPSLSDLLYYSEESVAEMDVVDGRSAMGFVLIWPSAFAFALVVR